MDQKTKIILSLMQVDNLVDLLEDNEYRTFFYGHLITMKCELNRQLTLIQSSANIEK